MASKRMRHGGKERTPRRWDEERIIAALRAIARRGVSISKRGLVEAGEHKLAQVINYFGGFRRVRRAAGLPPPPIRRSATSLPAGEDAEAIAPARQHSDAELLQHIRMLARDNPQLTLSELGQHPLTSTLCERFGSLEAAALRAGVPGWPLRRQASFDLRRR
jgi:hypothetical protein